MRVPGLEPGTAKGISLSSNQLSYTRSINKDLPEYYTAVRGKIGFMKLISNLQKRLTSVVQQLKNRWKTVAIIVVIVLGAGFYLMQKQQQNKVELTTTVPYQKNPGQNTRRVWNR